MMDGKEKKMFKDEGAADDWTLRLAVCDIVMDDSHVNMDFFFLFGMLHYSVFHEAESRAGPFVDE